ncbi:hypothetical protein ACI7CM_22920 [Xanthobacter sp. AM33]|uniref:hypothetical protein n=1 Tax=Xanthobacter sp. AM33 TaxID=3380644 RepID=UPI0039BFB56B
MVFYLRVVGEGHSNQVWRIDADEAVKLGVSNPESGPGTFYRRGDRDTIWAALRDDTGWIHSDGPESGPFHELALPPEHYYPRIARPLNGSLAHPKSPGALDEAKAVALGVGQATTLMRRLEAICQTVHPESETFGTYGHEIRNLLILAAMEVEAHWRGVLVANGRQRDRYSTNDYVRLLPVMQLNEYSVAFPNFPWLSPIQPFSGWTQESPTRSLTWYDAYNRVKHDREGDFSSARLDHAFAAVTACVIMLAAQWTPSIGLGGRSDLSSFFRFVEMPSWAPRESYTQSQPSAETAWTQIRNPELAS